MYYVTSHFVFVYVFVCVPSMPNVMANSYLSEIPHILDSNSEAIFHLSEKNTYDRLRCTYHYGIHFIALISCIYVFQGGIRVAFRFLVAICVCVCFFLFLSCSIVSNFRFSGRNYVCQQPLAK